MGKRSWVERWKLLILKTGLGWQRLAADDRNWCAAESPVEHSALSTLTGGKLLSSSLRLESPKLLCAAIP